MTPQVRTMSGNNMTDGTWAERDEDPCDRKLADLIAAAEKAANRLPQVAGEPVASENWPHRVRRDLLAAIAEARKQSHASSTSEPRQKRI